VREICRSLLMYCGRYNVVALLMLNMTCFIALLRPLLCFAIQCIWERTPRRRYAMKQVEAPGRFPQGHVSTKDDLMEGTRHTSPHLVASFVKGGEQ
jgi:hypothetical protein